MGTAKRPSETPEGVEWLSNFAKEDAHIARLLLDSIHFIDGAIFRRLLREHLVNRIREGLFREPCMLYSVRTIPKSAVMFENAVSPLPEPNIDSGSQLIVQNILRSVAGVSPGSPAIGPGTLKELRLQKARSIALVSDFSGSGDECISYARAWTRNASIRSWRSFGLLQIHLVSFALSPLAAHIINLSGYVDSVMPLYFGADFASAQWSDDEREQIIDLCRRYARKPTEALGYKKSAGLFVFQHTVPNNIPLILRQTRGPSRRPGGTWVPFFAGRAIPESIERQCMGYRPGHDPLHLLRSLGDHRLLAAEGARAGGREVSQVYRLLLAQLAAGERFLPQMSLSVGLPIPAVEQSLAGMSRLGLVDSRNRLTDAGWNELRQARIKPRRYSFELKRDRSFYYPSQLRESR